ncbi:glycosyltransferase family 2 protein [Alkaliphilus pronyensis]|uniref:Glycosyltransferase family 2 protein n=1 Tax=Alkaliphilus pronyensis TaxID=1482732 RepID=A0A6I0FTX1_9FIRM|nr:glycosyltransferase family 2 protein [Alkaliphilus pronyensis]KAB3539664.1 glycosyltransferase family 2 protein [Alkaliphilus pronyensis]
MTYIKPIISVVLVTYNRVNYLERALNSILSQTFTDFELILVNNGSTDGTDLLCQSYVAKDDRIKYITIPVNNGASIGRNVGIEAASSKYLTIVDDDDYCHEEMLEFLINLANTHNADIAMCGSYNDFGHRLEPYFVFEEMLILDRLMGLEELLKREKYNVAPPTKLFKRDLLNQIKFPEGVLVDDIHVIYKVFARARKVVVKGKPLYFFRKHSNNMTSFIQSNQITPDLLNEYLTMYKQRTLYLTERVPGIKHRAKYSEWSYMLSMCNKINQYHCKGCGDIYKDMLKQLSDHYEEIIHSPFTTLKEKESLNDLLQKEKLI